MKSTAIYLVVLDISGLGTSYEAFSHLIHALQSAKKSARTFAKIPLIERHDSPSKSDPDCFLYLTWGADDDHSVTVNRINLL